MPALYKTATRGMLVSARRPNYAEEYVACYLRPACHSLGIFSAKRAAGKAIIFSLAPDG